MVTNGNSFSICVGAQATQADGAGAFTAVKLTSAGLPDPTFGSGGFAVRQVGINYGVNGLVVLSTGQVVLSGSERRAAGTVRAVLVAFTPAGQPDAGFDGDGVAHPHVPGVSQRASAVSPGPVWPPRGRTC